MYWTDEWTEKIQRANLDGSNIEDLVTQGLEGPSGIALDVEGGKMYWADWGTDKIQRANLDGSNIQDLVTGLTAPYGIALDVAGGKMYWTDYGTEKIQRANLDGSNIQDLVTGLNTPYGIALDVTGGKMYWTDVNAAKIQRANLDGSNIEDLVTQGLGAPRGIALDVAGGKMYWIDDRTDKIQRANLDGSNIEDLVIELRRPEGIALGIPAAQQPTSQPTPQPDLVIQSLRSNKSALAPGERFTLSATVKNRGKGRALSTTLRYYRSPDATISSRDTQVGTDGVSALGVNRAGDESINLTAPTSPGTYYYGVCVDSVTDESDTANNCSTAVSVTVTAPPVVDPEAPLIYWTDFETKKIQRANLDGSNVQDLITQGLGAPGGIALDVTGGKMYWADWGTDKIQRANLDGSNVQDLVTGLTALYGIALDVAGGKMYWTDYGTDKIQRANLDGSNVQDLVTGLNTPYGIVLDVTGGKMYWTDVNAAKIQRANLDGSNVQDLVTGLGAPRGIALDVAGGKMYWADGNTDKIQRANLDGSNVQDLITQGLETPFDITLDLAGGKMYWTDVNAAKIQRANLDGSNAQDLVTGLRNSRGIALGIPAAQQPAPQPDLVVEAAQAVPATVAPGETFKLYATLKNQGTAESTATKVRYYRSTDNVISKADTQLGSANRNPLAPNATLRRYLIVTAPTAPGTYYYGVCVDSVTNEIDTANNCSTAVSVTVTAPAVVAEDVNADGVVDVQDLVYVARRYGQTGTNSADVNKDRSSI